jgi:hypothetical protein
VRAGEEKKGFSIFFVSPFEWAIVVKAIDTLGGKKRNPKKIFSAKSGT